MIYYSAQCNFQYLACLVPKPYHRLHIDPKELLIKTPPYYQGAVYAAATSSSGEFRGSHIMYLHEYVILLLGLDEEQ